MHVELAGVGSRASAALLDTIIASVGTALLVALLLLLAGRTAAAPWSANLTGWVLAFVVLLVAFTFLGYFALFEALSGGRTPGKRALGIRVVMETGHPVTPTAVVVRNLFRVLDCYLPVLPFLPGLAMIFLQRHNQRLGDLVAGTIVVRDRPIDWRLSAAPAPPSASVALGAPELDDAEFRLLDQFLARQDDLDPAVQARMAGDLARRFQDRLPRPAADPTAYLVLLHADELQKRRGPLAARARAGIPGKTTVTAERLVARKREAWEAFHEVATRVERAGVGALRAEEIPQFAARYREVAADLARARTYGVDPGVQSYLERVVSAGHNALYRARGRRRAPVLQYLLRDFPAAVVQSWTYVLAAFLCFAIPAAAGYALIRRHPELQDDLVSPVLVSRAREAAAHEARGIGYAESPEAELPVVASFVMSNNIRIGFLALVGGLLLGLGTVAVLVTNGLSIGTTLGLFVNYHAGRYLGTFVAGHGVLELAAIFVAGGAGFRIAAAIIAPGDRTRRDALVLEGRIAARLVGSAVTLLAIAGTIEGLLSASAAPAVYKLGVSAATVVFLFLYLAGGLADREARASDRGPVPPAGAPREGMASVGTPPA